MRRPRRFSLLHTVVSGGQTGADRGGLEAGRTCHVKTGGWAPLGWMTEDGPDETLKDYGLVEHPKRSYPARTLQNVHDSDGTLIFASHRSPGERATLEACRIYDRPFKVLDPNNPGNPWEVVGWLRGEGIHKLNVAGHRESKHPGIKQTVLLFLTEVITNINAGPRY